MQIRAIVFSLSICFISSVATAELRDIDRTKLPQSSSVEKSYQDVLTLEPYVKHWSPKWLPGGPSHDFAVKTLTTAIEQLKAADQNTPNHEELVLLLGLVAQYGHNVDIDGAAQLGIDSYKRAHTLAPQDYRSDWFLGIHRCEFGEVVEGMGMLLDVEKHANKSTLPATYWDDYLTCATVSNSPAHALHALQEIRAKGIALSDRQDLLEGANSKRYEQPSKDKEYDSKQIWSVDQSDKSRPRFSAEICGVRFSVPGNQGLRLYPTKNSQCAVVVQVGPHDTPGGPMYPNILLIARPAKEKETLEQFSKALQGEHKSTSTTRVSCPVADCIAFEALEPGTYKKGGDGYAMFTAFKSDEPRSPGVKFEVPQSPPKGGDHQIHYYHPTERFRRAAGTIYYSVLLDTASTMKADALKDLIDFLNSLEVE